MNTTAGNSILESVALKTGGAERGRWMAALEAVAPVAIAQGYIWSVSHARPRWMDVVCGAVIVVFVVVSIVQNGPRGLRSFGMAGDDSHRRAAPWLLAFTVGAIAFLALYGAASGRFRWDQRVWRAVFGYPFWGFVQQGLFLVFILPRLQRACGAAPSWLPPVLLAGVFAAAHAPNPLLMIGGGGMALTFALIWQGAPSLPLTAISHGLVGAVCDKLLDVSMRVGWHYFEP